jgi:hypothetical protein
MPDRDGVDALRGRAVLHGCLAVHVDAVRAAVQLGGAQPHELAQDEVDAGTVELGGAGRVKAVHSTRERRSQRVEVQALRDGDESCRGGHGVDGRGRLARLLGQSKAS